MPHWVVYSRPDCSLCEELLSELARMLGPQAAAMVAVVDITANPELERKYGTRIPVVLADDEFVCAYKLDKQRINAILS